MDTREVAMAKRIAGPVDAWTLSVPKTEDTIETRVLFEGRHLSAPDSGCRQLFIDTADEVHVRGVEHSSVLGNDAFNATEGRTSVAADECCKTRPGGRIDAVLVDRNAHERLRTRKRYLTRGGGETLGHS